MIIMETEPGIEPRLVALQAAALLYFSISYELLHIPAHRYATRNATQFGLILIVTLELMKLTN